MTHRPIDDVSNAMTFYATLGLDVRYFSALWHTFNVGHMLETDLDRFRCRSEELEPPAGSRSHVNHPDGHGSDKRFRP